MIFVLLFLEYFKTGLFAIGGGLATLPFLNDLANKYTWFTTSELSDMIAVSESTPGPIGVNMATYAGFTTGYSEFGVIGGIFGAFIATVALVLPSLVIIMIVAHFLAKFRSSKLVNDIFYTLRPSVCALIAVAWFSIVQICLIDISAFQSSGNIMDLFHIVPIILFAVMFACQKIFKKVHPVVYIAAGAVLGIVFKL
ncbi:MAG: chromate transporter [Clostridia bacterium]|nr:chromate transporter [Clostridia bacterium]